MFSLISDIETIIKNNDNKTASSMLETIDKIVYTITIEDIKDYCSRDVEKVLNFHTLIRAIQTNTNREANDDSLVIKSIQNIEYSIDRYKSNRLKVRLYHNDENY